MLYKVIIADDEDYIRELVAKMLNQKERLEVVGIAEDGAEALDLVRKLKPDILISDICMPLLNGLDLIYQIKSLDFPLKTVLISGYDEFSYVKKAITLGVKDYLLKPFSPEEIFAVLDKITDELDHQATLIRNMQELQEQAKLNLFLSQEQFLKAVIQNTVEDGDTVMEQGLKLQIDLRAPYYCVGVIQINTSENERPWNLKNQNIAEDFLNIIQDNYLDSPIKMYPFSFNNAQIVMIFCGHYNYRKIFYDNVKIGIQKIAQSLKKYYSMNIRCSLGRSYEHWQELALSYEDALVVWLGILEQDKQIVCYEEYENPAVRLDPSTIEAIRKEEKEIILHIQMSNQTEALQHLHQILKQYQRIHSTGIDFIKASIIELLFDISNALANVGCPVEVWEDENVINYLKNPSEYRCLLDAKIVLEGYICSCCDRFMTINEKQSEKIVHNAKMLIEYNLGNEEFNIDSAAATLLFSANYIRQLFKAKTELGFMEYLIKRRMEEAEKLLKSSSLKIQEVAMKVGYSDQKYFARCFKKHCGYSPTEYRDQRRS